MKTKTKITLAGLVAGVLALSALGLTAQDKNSSSVAAMLEGSLVQIAKGKSIEAKLGDPEYFVLYHSASW